MEIPLSTIDSLPEVTDGAFWETDSPNSLLLGLLGLLFVGVVQAVYLVWQGQKDATEKRRATMSNLQED
jgi:hypothetical protein